VTVSTRAALIYVHFTDERQREIADALDRLAREELERDQGEGVRTRRRETIGARNGHGAAATLREDGVLSGRSLAGLVELRGLEP
jgi:hypothetical protein